MSVFITVSGGSQLLAWIIIMDCFFVFLKWQITTNFKIIIKNRKGRHKISNSWLFPKQGHFQNLSLQSLHMSRIEQIGRVYEGKHFPSQHINVNSSRLQKLQLYSLISVCLCWSDTWLNRAIGKNRQTRGWLSCSDFHIYCLKPCGELSWMPIVKLTHWNKHTSAASIRQRRARTVFD